MRTQQLTDSQLDAYFPRAVDEWRNLLTAERLDTPEEREAVLEIANEFAAMQDVDITFVAVKDDDDELIWDVVIK